MKGRVVFRLTKPIEGFSGFDHEKFVAEFNTDVFIPGWKLARADDMMSQLSIESQPEPSGDGNFKYLVSYLTRDKTAFYPPTPKGAVFVKMGSHVYSEKILDWGPVNDGVWEEITLISAAKEALYALECLVDEYSDIRPILDNLKLAISESESKTV